MTPTRVQTNRQAWKSSTPGEAVPLSQDEVTELTQALARTRERLGRCIAWAYYHPLPAVRGRCT